MKRTALRYYCTEVGLEPGIALTNAEHPRKHAEFGPVLRSPSQSDGKCVDTVNTQNRPKDILVRIRQRRYGKHHGPYLLSHFVDITTTTDTNAIDTIR